MGGSHAFPLIPLPIKEAMKLFKRPNLKLSNSRKVSINSTSYKRSDLPTYLVRLNGELERVRVSINSTSYKRSDFAVFQAQQPAPIPFPLIPLPIKEAIQYNPRFPFKNPTPSKVSINSTSYKRSDNFLGEAKKLLILVSINSTSYKRSDYSETWACLPCLYI